MRRKEKYMMKKLLKLIISGKGKDQNGLVSSINLKILLVKKNLRRFKPILVKKLSQNYSIRFTEKVLKNSHKQM
jgi:hypothetical protein